MSSKQKFIQHILEAIEQLAERNGSNAKDILNVVLKSNKKTVKRCLTLQVRKALKQAVVQGFIRLRGGRYKAPSYPIKKPTRVAKKSKNLEKNCLLQEKGKKQTRRNKADKIRKKLAKDNRTGPKNHASEKPGKTKKRSKTPSK